MYAIGREVKTENATYSEPQFTSSRRIVRSDDRHPLCSPGWKPYARSGTSGFQPNVIYAWKIMKWNGDALGLQIDSCAEPLAPYTVLMHAAIDAVKRSDIPSASRVHFLTSNPDVNRLLNQDRSIRRKNRYMQSSRSKKLLSHANKWRELDDALDELYLRV